MLNLLREGWFSKSISSVLLTCIVTTSTASLAGVVPQNDVNSGQAAGMEFLGGAQTMPTISNGTSTLNATSDNTQLFLGDFMPGVTGAPDTSTMESLAENPEGLVAAGMVLRTSQKEAGCRTTTLTQRQAAKTVHRITAVWRDANGIETPATFNSPFRVNFPTLGIASRSEQVIQAGTGSTPALVLKYEHTPFQYPANSYFTYSPTIVGSVSGNFTSIGAPSNNFTLQGTFTANNASVIEIKADLFQVSRAFNIQGGACPADPETACAHQGINLCHSATSSLSTYFALKDQQGENDYGVLGLEMSRLAANAKDPDADEIGDAAAATLDGATAEFAELFSGCSKVETTEQGQLDQHVEQIVACQSRWAPQGACQQQRKITAAKTGRSITVRTWLNWLIRGGDAYVPAYSENIRATIKLFKMTEYQNSPWFEVISTSTGEALYFSLHGDTDFNYGQGQTPGNTFWYPRVTAGDASDLVFTHYGSLGNKWAPTINIRVGQEYTFEYEEYLITSDVVITGGSESCEFIARGIQDGICPSSGLASSCILGTSEGSINDLIPMGGAASSGIAEAAGSHPSMPPNCMLSNVNPMACQPADLLSEYFPNIEPPSWADNCHNKGKFVNPNGVSAAFSSGQCVRKFTMDACILAGDVTSTCYEKEIFFDCGEVKSRPVVTKVSTQEICGSPIRCLGTECANTVGEANSDLAQAMAAGNMVDALSQDIICDETGQPPSGPYETCTIRVFTGEFRECRMPVMAGGGIAPDCCEEGLSAASSMGIGATQAAMAFDAAKKLATNEQFTNMLANMPGSSFVEGAWSATKAVVQTITEPITSFAAKIGQKVLGDATMAAAKDGLASTGGQTFAVKMMQMTYNFLSDIGMEGIANALFQTSATTGAVSGLSAGAGMLLTALNVAMLVYSIAQIVGQLLYGCEEEEYELGMELQKKNCHATGTYCSKKFPELLGGGCEIRNRTYCCYKSPLNRIIAEQMRVQLGGYGSAKNPNCAGFTLDEVNNFDWASLDLSEWQQLLHEAGILPDNEQEAENKWGMDADRGVIASNGPSFGPDGAVSPIELVEDRFTGSEGLFEDARNELSGQAACSYNGGIQWYGSPQVFEDTSEVQDVFTVTRNYRVDSSYFGPCSGGDPDSVTTVVTHDIEAGTDSATAQYGCDGGSKHWGTINNLELLDTSYAQNGTLISSLPDGAFEQRCKETPSLEPMVGFFTTHDNAGTQKVSPSCVSIGSKKSSTTTTHSAYLSVIYTLRKHMVSATPKDNDPQNCIDPTQL